MNMETVIDLDTDTVMDLDTDLDPDTIMDLDTAPVMDLDTESGGHSCGCWTLWWAKTSPDGRTPCSLQNPSTSSTQNWRAATHRSGKAQLTDWSAQRHCHSATEKNSSGLRHSGSGNETKNLTSPWAVHTDNNCAHESGHEPRAETDRRRTVPLTIFTLNPCQLHAT